MQLEAQLGYFFFDKQLLQRALTTPERAIEAAQLGESGLDQQALAQLGQALLTTVLIEFLVRQGTDTEAALTAAQIRLTQPDTVVALADAIGVGFFIKLSAAEKRERQYENPQLLVKTFMAVLGATYLDGGFRTVREAIGRLYRDEFPDMQ